MINGKLACSAESESAKRGRCVCVGGGWGGAVSQPQNGKQMGCTLVHTQGIIQPGRRSEVLRVSLPRLNVLETQMGKDVLFCRSCQELFLEEGQASKHKVSDESRNLSR